MSRRAEDDDSPTRRSGEGDEYEVEEPRESAESSRGRRFALLVRELGLHGASSDQLRDGFRGCSSRRYIIHPENWLYRVWTKVILLWAVYSSVVTPLEFGFFRGLPEKLLMLDVFGQLAFLVDIALHFFLAYRDAQTYRTVYKPRLIALRYLKFDFLVDFLCCLPWDYLYKAYSAGARGEALLVRATIDGEEETVLVFKGFSSLLSSGTSANLATSVLPARAAVASIDIVRGPFDPSNIEYLERGLTWEDFKSRYSHPSDRKHLHRCWDG